MQPRSPSSPVVCTHVAVDRMLPVFDTVIGRLLEYGNDDLLVRILDL